MFSDLSQKYIPVPVSGLGDTLASIPGLGNYSIKKYHEFKDFFIIFSHFPYAELSKVIIYDN